MQSGAWLGRRIALALASLLLFAALAEVALRALLPDRYYVWPPGFTWTAEPKLEGVRGPSQLRVNSFGVRGDEWTGRERYRVLAVGGSTTLCTELDDTETWPHLVQARLDAELGDHAVWVGNVGRAGHGTAQHTVQLEKLLPQHPEIDAVLLLAGINDMLFHLGWSLVPRDVPRPAPSPREGHSAGDPFSVTPVRDSEGSWYRRLALTRALARLASGSSESDSPIIDRGLGFVNDARRARQQAREYRDELPDLAMPLSGYAAALRKIAGIARARGVRLIFLTQPVFWRPDLDGPDQARLWMGGAPFGIQGKDAVFYSVEALARGMQRYNAAMLRVCAELSIECVDLAGALPRDGSVFIDDAHFTEHGAQLVADQVAAHLRSTEPLRSFVSAGS